MCIKPAEEWRRKGIKYEIETAMRHACGGGVYVFYGSRKGNIKQKVGKALNKFCDLSINFSIYFLLSCYKPAII